MNYLIYPLKVMNITQSYYDSYSHLKHTKGNLKDYPIDDSCGVNEYGYFYCSCDEMIVKKVYGVGINASNTIWLESTTPVITPTFTDYVTIMVVHPNDNNLKNVRVGKKYKRGEKIFYKGSDGIATGPHFHIAVGRGKFLGSGWKKNNLNLWILQTTKNNIKPEAAFFIDKNFTKINNTRSINFVTLYENNTRSIYYTTANLNVRYGPGTNYKVVNTLPAKTKITVEKVVNNFAKINDKEYVSVNYLSKNSPSNAYNTKKCIALFLNVRSKPNGKILYVISKNTTVGVMQEKNGWTKIYNNKYVASRYLK